MVSPQGNFRHTETHSAVSREELMMVLAGLQQLQIRAPFSKFSRAVSLRRVALEVASKMGGGPLASNVELCMCPANYLGDSCQVRWEGTDTVSLPSTPASTLAFHPHWCHPPFSPPTGCHPPSTPTLPLQAEHQPLAHLPANLSPHVPASP